MTRTSKILGRTAAVAVAVSIGAGAATAGGFFVREQGALGQGASFAGAGASTALSAMFWNSAAVTSLDGLNADSTVSVILPEATFTATSSSFPTANQSTDIGVNAYVPASYLNYQFKNFDKNLYLGLGVNSAFGLKTEPDRIWAGSTVGASTRLFSVNFNPTLGYKLSDKLSIGVGAQFEYAKGVFKFATGAPAGPATFYEGDSLAVGATAGLMFTPSDATRIGLGWRSQMTHELEGRFATGSNTIGGGLFTPGVRSKVDLRLPDIVNLSLVQAIAPNARVMATVEWTNWARFGGLEVVADSTGNVITKAGPGNLTGAVTPGSSIAKISGAWEDGWFFSGGFEYDVNKQLTVRAGGAYEISPITKATERITSIPDADRIWASLGFSYKVNAATTIDFGYSHVFVDDAKIDRLNVTETNFIKADLDASVDIISLGMRMKLN